MAEKTPDSRKVNNMGSMTLLELRYTSTNLDDADTYTSGITGIVNHWFGATNNPGTQASAGVHVSRSGGTFTFFPGEDNATGTLFVLKK